MAKPIESMNELLAIITESAAKYNAYGCIAVLHTEDECISIQYGLDRDELVESAQVIMEHKEHKGSNN